jgi:hypothetical protein
MTEQLHRSADSARPPRYFVSEYTDGPATRWNVIDRHSQEWVQRFRTEQEANDWAAGMNHGKGGPTEKCPDRPYCKPDQSCCDFCCGN